MIDRQQQFAEFVAAYDEMRDRQKRFFRTKANTEARRLILQEALFAEAKADALRKRLGMPGDPPQNLELPL